MNAKTKKQPVTLARAVKAKDLDTVKTIPKYKEEAEQALARLAVSYVLKNEYLKLYVTS